MKKLKMKKHTNLIREILKDPYYQREFLKMLYLEIGYLNRETQIKIIRELGNSL